MIWLPGDFVKFPVLEGVLLQVIPIAFMHGTEAGIRIYSYKAVTLDKGYNNSPSFHTSVGLFIRNRILNQLKHIIHRLDFPRKTGASFDQ